MEMKHKKDCWLFRNDHGVVLGMFYDVTIYDRICMESSLLSEAVELIRLKEEKTKHETDFLDAYDRFVSKGE